MPLPKLPRPGPARYDAYLNLTPILHDDYLLFCTEFYPDYEDPWSAPTSSHLADRIFGCIKQSAANAKDKDTPSKVGGLMPRPRTLKKYMSCLLYMARVEITERGDGSDGTIRDEATFWGVEDDESDSLRVLLKQKMLEWFSELGFVYPN